MPDRVRFVPDHKEFGEFILSEQMRDVTAEVAADIKSAARAGTPIGEGRDGHMRDKYEVVREAGTLKVAGNVRVMVKVENNDPESALVEFGSKHNKRRRMLAKAGAMFGDFKSKKGI